MPDLEKDSLVLTEPIVYRRRWYILTGTVVILNSYSQIDQILRHFTSIVFKPELAANLFAKNGSDSQVSDVQVTYDDC